MLSFLRNLLTLFVVLSMSLAFPVYASGQDGAGGGSPMTSGGGGAGLTNSVTKKVVKTLKSGINRCQRIEKIYRFDCYRQTYKLAASYLFGRPAYAGALEALKGVEKALDQIMARDTDPQQPTIRRGIQTFKPIKPATVPKATAQLDQALTNAETILLRAPERTGTHYARIAEAVNSNKVLLRSRLYPEGGDLYQTAFA